MYEAYVPSRCCPEAARLNLDPPTSSLRSRPCVGGDEGWCRCGGCRVLGRCEADGRAFVGCQRLVIGARRAGPQDRGSAGGGLESAQRVERCRERRCPWPVGRHPKCWSSGAVDEPAGDRKQPGPQRAGDNELVVDADLAGDRGPTDHVVRQHGALQPGRVGLEVAGRDVLEPGTFFEIADRELDHSVAAMKLIEFDSCAVEIGEEREVTPIGATTSTGACP